MSKLTPLFIGLTAVIVGIPLAVLVLYAWLFPMFHAKTLYGVLAAVLIAGGLSFQFIKSTSTLRLAGVGACVVAVIVCFLSMLLIANVLGT